MTNIPTGRQRRLAYLFVRSNPGCTTNEAAAGLPDDNPISVGATMSHLHRDGFLSRQRKGLGYRYFIAEPVAPQPLVEGQKFEQMKLDLPDAEMKLRRAELFDVGVQLAAAQEAHAEQTRRLHARIGHLEQWRDDAIARYPDLGADPALLAKARQIIIELFEVTTHQADDILAGEWDDKRIVQAILEALRSGVL
jgi:hypothetical protein